ncbi:MAG TPA: DNA double-strand break repair nuclease NurA [Nitrososphaera sp.]|nr:DNA double-strand break repair nuclease NurA [Nitrososphaera sp.]
MFNDILLDAIRNREAKLAGIKDVNYDRIMAQAKSQWADYEPRPAKCKSAGIDSSWNKRGFQGLDLYAIAAVAVTSANGLVAREWESSITGVARAENLDVRAMAMEARMAQQAVKDPTVDITCVDGSIVARARGSLDAGSVLRQYGESVFIAKTSNSRLQFEDLDSKAGDIYYYGHLGRKAGFSIPRRARFSAGDMYEVYARLKDHTPVVRIEIDRASWGTGIDEVKLMLDMLSYHSVAGYPYCLKLAHKTCKISNEDIDRLASIYSLQNEQGARDALNE